MLLSPSLVSRAARALADARFLLVCAGAGLGVDSGLPDFRGDEGFWRAYPPLKALGISFVQMANPRWFERDPQLAWGFYGHRLNLYRATTPHAGFAVLKRWAQERSTWVYTSNVDGQFQKAGFDANQICEVHGSIHHLQCTRPCSPAIWSAEGIEIEVGPDFRARGELPRCPHCGALARPNILMFSDGAWNLGRSLAQERALMRWMDSVRGERAVVVELGAGSAIPTVRRFSEIAQGEGASLVRINPRESSGPPGTISLACGAREGVEAIEAVLT